MEAFPSLDIVNWYKSGLGKTGHQGNLGAGQILLLNGGSFLRLPYLVEVPEPSDLAFLAEPVTVNEQPKPVVVGGSFRAEELFGVILPLSPFLAEQAKPLVEGQQTVVVSCSHAGEPPLVEDLAQPLVSQQAFQAVLLGLLPFLAAE